MNPEGIHEFKTYYCVLSLHNPADNPQDKTHPWQAECDKKMVGQHQAQTSVVLGSS